jgi:hypothetical protein
VNHQISKYQFYWKKNTFREKFHRKRKSSVYQFFENKSFFFRIETLKVKRTLKPFNLQTPSLHPFPPIIKKLKKLQIILIQFLNLQSWWLQTWQVAKVEGHSITYHETKGLNLDVLKKPFQTIPNIPSISWYHLVSPIHQVLAPIWYQYHHGIIAIW